MQILASIALGSDLIYPVACLLVSPTGYCAGRKKNKVEYIFMNLLLSLFGEKSEECIIK